MDNILHHFVIGTTKYNGTAPTQNTNLLSFWPKEHFAKHLVAWGFNPRSFDPEYEALSIELLIVITYL